MAVRSDSSPAGPFPPTAGRMAHVVTVAESQRVQANWFGYRAETLGREVWTDGPLTWTDGPDGQNVMFPKSEGAGEQQREVDQVDREHRGDTDHRAQYRRPVAPVGQQPGQAVPEDREEGGTADHWYQ